MLKRKPSFTDDNATTTTTATATELPSSSLQKRRQRRAACRTGLLLQVLALVLLCCASLLSSTTVSSPPRDASGSSISDVIVVERARFCLKHRGFSGHWDLDWEFGKLHDYSKAVNLFKPAFVATEGQPVRMATAYVWKDDACPYQLVNQQNFCQVLGRLNIDNIVIVGDSLSGATWDAMLWLLGSQPYRLKVGQDAPFRDIKCKNNDGSIVRIQQFREYGWPFERKHVFSYILNNTTRSVVLWNVGAHHHNYKNFTVGMNETLQAYQNHLGGSNHIAIYRPTVPGHKDCLPRERPRKYDWSIPVNVTPYKNYTEYLKDETTQYTWNLFKDYNAYTQRRINELGLNIHYMNVFNSTVLRRDGHPGAQDCLHYLNPGPIDWWVHHLYNDLLDFASIEEAENKTKSFVKFQKHAV